MQYNTVIGIQFTMPVVQYDVRSHTLLPNSMKHVCFISAIDHLQQTHPKQSLLNFYLRV